MGRGGAHQAPWSSAHIQVLELHKHLWAQVGQRKEMEPTNAVASVWSPRFPAGAWGPSGAPHPLDPLGGQGQGLLGRPSFPPCPSQAMTKNPATAAWRELSVMGAQGAGPLGQDILYLPTLPSLLGSLGPSRIRWPVMEGQMGRWGRAGGNTANLRIPPIQGFQTFLSLQNPMCVGGGGWGG